jgi:hypothetical protein
MRSLVAAATVVAAALTLLSSTVTASAATLPRFSRYVALGDSYTAGPLVPLQRLDPVGCLRSTANYPAQLAARLRIRSFTDVSCSGADTSDMTIAQDVAFGPNPPQPCGPTPTLSRSASAVTTTAFSARSSVPARACVPPTRPVTRVSDTSPLMAWTP